MVAAAHLSVLRREGDYEPHSQGQAPQPACLESNTLAMHGVSTLAMAAGPCHARTRLCANPLHARAADTYLTLSAIRV